MGNTHRVTTRLFLILVLVCSFVSCTQEKRYRVLSFFFDGVPSYEQSAASDSQPQNSTMLREEQLVTGEMETTSTELNNQSEVVHEPFRERACESCHQRSATSFLSEQGSDLCFQCHDYSPFKAAYVHGPVAVGACTFCHHPHRSFQASLLQKPVRELCLSVNRRIVLRGRSAHTFTSSRQKETNRWTGSVKRSGTVPVQGIVYA